MSTTKELLVLVKRAKLEEALARACDKGRALVGQVDKLVQTEAVHHVVHEHRAVGVLGLADDAHGARVIQVQVVHEGRPPGGHAVGAAVAHVADQRVAAAVVVAGGVVGSEAVLLLELLVIFQKRRR